MTDELTYFDISPSGYSKSQVGSKGETDDPNSVCTDLRMILKEVKCWLCK